MVPSAQGSHLCSCPASSPLLSGAAPSVCPDLSSWAQSPQVPGLPHGPLRPPLRLLPWHSPAPLLAGAPCIHLHKSEIRTPVASSHTPRPQRGTRSGCIFFTWSPALVLQLPQSALQVPTQVMYLKHVHPCPSFLLQAALPSEHGTETTLQPRFPLCTASLPLSLPRHSSLPWHTSHPTNSIRPAPHAPWQFCRPGRSLLCLKLPFSGCPPTCLSLSQLSLRHLIHYLTPRRGAAK